MRWLFVLIMTGQGTRGGGGVCCGGEVMSGR